MKNHSLPFVSVGWSLALAAASLAQSTTAPAPEAKPSAQRPKVQVFVLMGQSNMVGMGDLEPPTAPGTLSALTKAGRYPFLVDEKGKWTVRDDVYYYDARTEKGAPLSATANNGKSIGPELGFGFAVGDAIEAPVLLLKSCIGNRSLGWDLLPPGSERFVEGGRTYAGYGDSPDSWVEGEPKKVVDWYAGKQYDTDLANAKKALARLDEILPAHAGQGYEIAGFVWWQGHKDQNPVHAARYEQNLARLIPTLRRDYDAPKARFVLATIAFGGWQLAGPGKTVAEAQLAIADAKRHPEFKDSVRCVEARGFWREAKDSPNARQGHHYFRNAETYLEVGIALGKAMVELLAAPESAEAREPAPRAGR